MPYPLKELIRGSHHPRHPAHRTRPRRARDRSAARRRAKAGYSAYVRQRFPAGQVNGYYQPIIKGVGQQQDLEVGRVAVPIHAALGEWG